MAPNLTVHSFTGILRSASGESVCSVTQRVAGQGESTYYANAAIVDSSVSPSLPDGDYEFRYRDESGDAVPVTRENGFWLKVPPSARPVKHG